MKLQFKRTGWILMIAALLLSGPAYASAEDIVLIDGVLPPEAMSDLMGSEPLDLAPYIEQIEYEEPAPDIAPVQTPQWEADVLVDAYVFPTSAPDGYASDVIRGGVHVEPAHDFTMPRVYAGESLVLAVPLKLVADGATFWSCTDHYGVHRDYTPGEAPSIYEQTATSAIHWLRLELDTPVNDLSASPLMSDGSFIPQAMLIDDNGNHGYAVMDGLYISPDATPGTYTLSFTARWRAFWDTEDQLSTFTLALHVLGDGYQPEDMKPTDILGVVEMLEQADAVSSADPQWDESTAPSAESILDIVQTLEENGVEPLPVMEEPAAAEEPHEDEHTMPTETDGTDISPISAEEGAPVDEMALRDITFDTVREGERVMLPVAIAMQSTDERWVSNTGADGGHVQYQKGLATDTFRQDIPAGVSELYVRLDAAQFEEEDCPFTLAEDAAMEAVIIKDGINRGYAAFGGLVVKEGAQAGDYPIRFEVRWSTQTDESDVLPTAGAGHWLTSLFGIPSAHAEGEVGEVIEEYSAMSSQMVTLSEILVNCPCLSETGTGICECPFGGPDCGCDCEPMEMALMAAEGRMPPPGWVYSTTADDASAYLVNEADSTQAIVFNFDQYLKAIKTDGKASVTIGYSTDENTAPGGWYDGMPVNNGLLTYTRTSIDISKDVTTFTLDGLDPTFGVIATVHDNDQNGGTNLLKTPSSTSTSTVIMKNLNWDGGNIYGMFYAPGRDITAYFQNVDYTGVQQSYLPAAGTKVVYDNCNITITKASRWNNNPEELTQVSGVRFEGGPTTITGDTSAVLFNALNTGNFAFDVAQGTEVTINSSSHVLYPGFSAMTIDGTLTANLTGSGGGLMYTTHTADTLTVNGKMVINYAATSGSYAALCARDMIVNEGAILEVNRRPAGGGNGDAIRVSTFRLNNPYRVAIYNANGAISSSHPTYIDTQSINIWSSGAPDPAAGMGVLSAPTGSWNNQGMSRFTYSSGSVSGLDNNEKGVSPTAPVLNQAALAFTTNGASRYFAAGQTNLSVNPTYFGQGSVSGTSSGSQTIGYQYGLDQNDLPTGNPVRMTESGGGGSYTLSLPGGETWSQQSSMVFVLGYDNGLYAWQRTANKLNGTLALHTAPDMSFENMQLISTPYLRLRTEPYSMSVMGADTRGYYDAEGNWVTSGWQLLARQVGAFTSDQDGSTLSSGLIFIDSEGTQHSMLDTDVLSATGQCGEDGPGFLQMWEAEEGIHFQQVPNDGTPGHSYTTTIRWTLIPEVAGE